ncbi:amidohydrolase family protein, partial [Chloroflexota bacterium]
GLTKPLDLPELMPLYELMTKYDLPIWIHPRRGPSIVDYTSEDESKYRVWFMFGWPYETTVAMTRLVFSGVLDRYPNLKIITHHCGAMVPFLANRIKRQYEFAEARCATNYVWKFSKPPVEYFRMFYADTALHGNTPALMCGRAFFGVDRILFGTDAPNDSEIGNQSTRETIEAIEQMNIPESEKQKIFQDNAKAIMNLEMPEDG